MDFHSQSEHIYIIGYTKNSRPKLLFGFFNLKTKSSVICCILSCTCMPIAFDNDLVYSECHSQTVLRNIPRMRNPERFTLIKDRWDADFFCNHILILQRLRFMLHVVQLYFSTCKKAKEDYSMLTVPWCKHYDTDNQANTKSDILKKYNQNVFIHNENI